ncbi:glycerol-3-phosphate phosphatase-like [Teleopsis dalmanni]|nr:glycerol-3-phosphate phosphatase-like [Teleopsis dalmanni]
MYHIPDTGSIVSSIESCVDRAVMQMGKPNPLICEGLINAGVLKTERTLMIGDCCKIDVTFGKNCGFQTLLVGTGSYQLEKLHNIYPNIEDYRKYIPDTYLPALGDLLTFL